MLIFLTMTIRDKVKNLKPDNFICNGVALMWPLYDLCVYCVCIVYLIYRCSHSIVFSCYILCLCYIDFIQLCKEKKKTFYT
jgi:small-conductance mechanosensitive channel